MNCGEVQPHASMWGPTDLGRMTEASTITEIHQNPTAWDTKIEADTAEGKKYMFCALTPGEYNQCRTDDGTVDRTHHSEHTTGFTSWHCSIHDALRYALWCLLTGVILYTEKLYICAWVPNPYKLVTQLYHGWSKGFNRGFQSLMMQGDAYTFDTCEHGTGRTLRIQMNWNRVLAEYSFENGWCWNQYIPLCIREYLDSSGMDPRHGAMSMVIYNHGVSFARHLQEPLRSDLLTYSERSECISPKTGMKPATWEVQNPGTSWWRFRWHMQLALEVQPMEYQTRWRSHMSQCLHLAMHLMVDLHQCDVQVLS